MAWLLDTNVISELRKPRPNASVIRFLEACPRRNLFLSIVSVSELQYGANVLEDPAHQQALNQWLSLEIRPLFQNQTLQITEAVMLRWLALVDQGRRRNFTFSQPDLFLAATALEHDLTLVTRNMRDFQGIERLELHNPWG